MPPKTIFTKEDDEILLEIVRTRVQNNWTEAELERQFKQSTGRKLSFKTLRARLNVLNPVQSSITIVRPGTSASFLNSEICLPVDQPMSLSHEQPIIDQHMTSLTHEADIANLTSELDQSLSIIEDTSEAGNSIQLNVAGNDSVTPKPRRNLTDQLLQLHNDTMQDLNITRAMEKRILREIETPEQTQVQLQEQLDQIDNVSTEEPPNLNISSATRFRIRREIETPEQTQQRQINDAQSHREQRANETPEQTLERQTLDSQLHRERKANETSAELNVRLNSDAARDRSRKGNETPEQKADRLQKAAERDRKKRENETPEQRAKRLQKNKDNYAKNKVVETERERMDRLGLNFQRKRQQQHTLLTHMLWSILRQTIEEVDDQSELINVCEFCGALYWSVPQLDRIHPLIDLWTNAAIRIGVDLVNSVDFFANIRQYNSLFGMCAVKSNFDPQDLDNGANDQRRFNARGQYQLPYLFKCSGAMYYRMPPMYNGPVGVLRTRAAQYLMMDSDRAMLDSMLTNWAQNHGEGSEEVIGLLYDMLKEILAQQNARDPLKIGLWMIRFVPRNENVPINAKGRRQIVDTAVNGEVAVVFNDQDGLPDDGFIMYAVAREQGLNLINIVPQTINNHMQSIDMRNPNCDPLCFPLLFS
ncbi:DEAD-box ATP-dependent RNA helicase 42-like [Brachionus plicatilis]|uniref:DEAD-box ATP-dependent RNA helicase 42-like n=1 Tax=Brachionus plicatilis TaxID=10195 RepID=A0A3M7QEM1_BRAPC|nr:DEAD-box ATP-dependent RNA helicase 42-like [Brachionus plicatilis]